MEQKNIDVEMRIAIDFDNSDVPTAVKELQPIVWRDGDSYCCLLGPDSEAGIFGCGATPLNALIDWDDNLRERIKQDNPEDEVTQYAIASLKAIKYDNK